MNYKLKILPNQYKILYIEHKLEIDSFLDEKTFLEVYDIIILNISLIKGLLDRIYKIY